MTVAAAAMMDGVQPDSAAPTRPLVGRTRELDELTALLGIAGDPSAQAVLLAGDAGVGKTRLLAELRDIARDAGWQVVAGHCLDFGDAALPYLPFSEIVGRLPAETVERVAETHPAVRRLQPGRRVMSSTPDDGPVDRADLFAAVHALLEEVAVEAPLLVVVEDVHWADQSSRDLLSFLFVRPFEQRVEVVASYRTDDLHRRHPLRRTAAEWGRLPGVERLPLAPLAAADVRRFVRTLHAGRLPEHEIHEIISRAEGNAFFVEELVGAAEDGRAALPWDLAELLLLRLERLDEPTRAVVRAAAVAGRRGPHHLLPPVAVNVIAPEPEM